jgi:hypothetical protein
MGPEDVALYRQHGAHCLLGKELPAAEFIAAVGLRRPPHLALRG